MPVPTPPVATPIHHKLTVHGHTRIDPYYWLREKSNPAVISHLEAENAYAEAVMAHTVELQHTLYTEMLNRIQETDLSLPVKRGPFLYYSRTEKGKQYPIYCRKPDRPKAEETVLLDLNAEADGSEYLRLGVYEMSPDHSLLAYSLDTTGSEDYTVYIKDLVSGELLPDRIPRTSYSLEWASDNRTLFYTTQDTAKRPHKLYRHRLMTDPSEDSELYHEADELHGVHLYKTKDQAYLVLSVDSIETGEVSILPADTPQGRFRLVLPRQTGRRYSVEHRYGLLYILTNDAAKNFRLVTAPVADLTRENWREFVPHRESVKLDDIDVFADYLVLYEREQGLRTLRVHHFTSGHQYCVSFPEPVYTYAHSEKPEFDADTLRFTYMSLTTPDSTFDYDMARHTRTLRKQKPVLGNFEADAYRSERVFATARDGTRIPISLVYKKGLRRDGSNPCLLYGYGSYGSSLDPWFSSNRLSLLDRGFVYALAHIRGGEEMGRDWYEQGKMLSKKQTFTDFIACGQTLVAKNYTRSDRLVIMGGSAGGLLIGAVMNMAPCLAAVAVAQVPFVDVVTTMLDESLPLTVAEYEEWGNPQLKAYYDYMLSYSPYDNVKAQAYPHLLITAGLNDPRVQYWEPAKWTAKLRTTKTDTRRLVLKTNTGSRPWRSLGPLRSAQRDRLCVCLYPGHAHTGLSDA